MPPLGRPSSAGLTYAAPLRALLTAGSLRMAPQAAPEHGTPTCARIPCSTVAGASPPAASAAPQAAPRPGTPPNTASERRAHRQQLARAKLALLLQRPEGNVLGRQRLIGEGALAGQVRVQSGKTEAGGGSVYGRALVPRGGGALEVQGPHGWGGPCDAGRRSRHGPP